MRTDQTKLKKTILILSGLLTILLAGQAYSKDKDPRMTGLPELTQEELQWQNKHMLRVKKVKLNSMGLERVNKWRKNKGFGPKLMRKEDLIPGKDLEVTVGESHSIYIAIAPPSADIPSTVDNSKLKYFPPIRSQGSLNSCGVFSGVYYTMTYMHALAKDLDAKNGNNSVRLSPKWAYNMVNGGRNSGSWYYWAYEIGQKHGNATWMEFPYDSNYKAWSLNPDTWLNSLYRKFDQYGYVANTHTDEGINLVKEMLLNGYILNIPTYINSWKWKTIKDDLSTPDDDELAGKSCVAWVNGTQGYHAMTVVGYNDDIWVDINGNNIVDSGEKGAFRIANSWGTGWRESGFAWMAYDALKNPSSVPGGPATGRVYGWSPARAHWVTAKDDYSPKVVGRFTLNHLKRNHLRITLGVSDTTDSASLTLWAPEMIYNQGGTYAFNGTTKAVNGTFVFDFTDILPAGGQLKTYYLNLQDDTNGDQATLLDFSLIDLSNGRIETYSTDIPQIADGETISATVDYNYNDSNVPPVAHLDASVLSGVAPLPVTFDGSASYDPDGTIALYQWDFDDGSQENGDIVNHTYENAGTYTASLTITDDMGATHTQIIDIEVLPDPTKIAFISELSARLIKSGTRSQAKIIVQILDQNMNPVSNALVQGRWSGLVGGNVSGNTDSEGYIEFKSRKTRKTGTFTFTVENVVVSGYTYDPSQNISSTISQSTQEEQNNPPTAVISPDTVSGTAPLKIAFDGSESFDKDGSILSYEWDFGDGSISYDTVATHVFYNPGTFTVKLTVTDDQGASHSSEVQIQANSGFETSMFVSNITMNYDKKGPFYTGNARVFVVDENNQPVANASVTAIWDGVVSSELIGKTDSSGSILFTSDRTKNSGPIIILVTNITASGFLYAPDRNVESWDVIMVP